MINNVTLVGRITKEPELRYTPQIKQLLHLLLQLIEHLKMLMEKEKLTLSIVLFGVNQPKTWPIGLIKVN